MQRRRAFLTVLSGGKAASSLLTGLVAYWKMNETSAGSSPVQRADSAGVNHLSDNNTVASTTGKLGNAARMVTADGTYLSCADNAALSIGNSDFECVMWVRLTADTTGRFISKDNSISDREYGVQYNQTDKRFHCFVFSGTDIKSAVATTFGQPSLNTWYMLDIYFDKTAQQLGISVNGGAFDTTATGWATINNGGNPLLIGSSWSLGSPTEHISADIDEVGFWKRILTAAERTALYNGGSGSTYPFDGSNP